MKRSEIKPGDVLRYTSLREFDSMWCREGTALVTDDGRALDTYWASGGESHGLTGAELETAELIFNVADYNEVPAHYEWETFSPADRERITSQHGLQTRWFVRKGAEPDIDTQIQNAREKVEQKESDLRAAQASVDWARRELAELESKARTSRAIREGANDV